MSALPLLCVTTLDTWAPLSLSCYDRTMVIKKAPLVLSWHLNELFLESSLSCLAEDVLVGALITIIIIIAFIFYQGICNPGGDTCRGINFKSVFSAIIEGCVEVLGAQRRISSWSQITMSFLEHFLKEEVSSWMAKALQAGESTGRARVPFLAPPDR